MLSKGSLPGPVDPTPSCAAPSSCLTSWEPVPREWPILTEKTGKKAEGSHSTYPHPTPNIQTERQEKYFLKNASVQKSAGTLLVVQWWGRWTPSAGARVPTPGQGTQALQGPRPALRSHALC